MTANRNRIIFVGFTAALVTAAVIFLYLKTNLKQTTAPRASSEYQAFIQLYPKHVTIKEGGRAPVLVKLKNLGTSAWQTTGKSPCYVSYHLLDHKRNPIQYENRRFSLPRTLRPQETLEMEIVLRAPLAANKFILEFDVLKEGIVWFKDLDSKTSEIILHVEEKKWPDSDLEVGLEYGEYSHIESSIPEINTLFKLIRLTLEENEVEFEGKLGKIHGFSAGKTYPQIWLRDANTIFPASRYFYDISFLSSWIEEHLAYQDKEGGLYDWINAKGESDKNTTETDQEASAVLAAHQVYLLQGTPWLEREIDGIKIIDRLERALEYVLLNRFHQQYNLIIGAHTADWGDVDMVDADQQTIYVDEKTHWTIDIYDQSMFHHASLNLAEMLNACGETDKAKVWTKRAASIQTNTNSHLWQPDKGFYKVHIHLDSLTHDFEEENLFPMGGNTVAILSGLADEYKVKKIIENALERQSVHEISTISGVLLPPYPAGIFKHPIMDDPYEYQNGAQWDWFGGRLLLAMFENGYSQIAREKLIEVIQKNISNRGFFEWDNPQGTGQGSDLFCGSAGVLSQALIQGYLGIQFGRDILKIEPKLGQDSVKVHLYLPSNDTYVAYVYWSNQNSKKATFRYNTNFSGKGFIKILCPALSYHRVEDLYRVLTVEANGKIVPYLLESQNEDVYINFDLDLQGCDVEISWN